MAPEDIRITYRHRVKTANIEDGSAVLVDATAILCANVWVYVKESPEDVARLRAIALGHIKKPLPPPLPWNRPREDKP